MKISKDKTGFTFKRLRIQFRGNYELVPEEIVRSYMKVAVWISPLAVWKIVDIIEALIK